MRSEQFETFEYVLTEIDIFLCYINSAALYGASTRKVLSVSPLPLSILTCLLLLKITFIPLTFILKVFLKQSLPKQASAKQSNAFISQIFTEYPLIDKCIGLIVLPLFYRVYDHKRVDPFKFKLTITY